MPARDGDLLRGGRRAWLMHPEAVKITDDPMQVVFELLAARRRHAIDDVSALLHPDVNHEGVTQRDRDGSPRSPINSSFRDRRRSK